MNWPIEYMYQTGFHLIKTEHTEENERTTDVHADEQNTHNVCEMGTYIDIPGYALQAKQKGQTHTIDKIFHNKQV